MAKLYSYTVCEFINTSATTFNYHEWVEPAVRTSMVRNRAVSQRNQGLKRPNDKQHLTMVIVRRVIESLGGVVWVGSG